MGADVVAPDPAVMPGGPAALEAGCLCDPEDNRHGIGVGGIPVYVDEAGVAHGYGSPVYVVDPDCAVHPLSDRQSQDHG